MALQPNMNVLNQSAQTFATELSKFSNIPAIAGGNAILDAIANLSDRITALGDRVTDDINNSANRLITRLRAADRNQVARLVNSSCNQPNSTLSLLVNAQTGNAIVNFPATVADMQALSGPDVNRILTELDQAIGGTLGNRRNRLTRAVGIVVQAAGSD